MKPIQNLTVLCVILFVPFALREMHPRAEPFPAVLFPVGAGVVQVDSQVINSSRLEIFAIDSAGIAHKLPPTHFIHPIPRQYLPHLALRKFGLAAADPKVIQASLGSWQVAVKSHRSSTSIEKREVANWLASRLEAVGRPLDRTLLVRKTNLTIDTVTGSTIATEIAFEYEVCLDDYTY